MNIQRQAIFWIAGVILLGLALYVLSDILLPFVAGLAIAYFLDPVADRLEKLGMGRLGAVSIIVAVFALIFLLALLLIVPVLSKQLSSFIANLPGYVETLIRLINEAGPDWLKKMLAAAAEGREKTLGDLAGRGAQWVAGVLGSVWSGGMALVSLLSLLVVTPVVAFYMLYDWDRMVALVDSYLPRPHAETLRELFRDMDRVMAGFVRGQGTVCLVLGLFYAVGLTVAGLNFGLLIGLVAGLLSFIPYVGSIVGLLLSAGVAVVQFWPELLRIFAVLAIFVAGQVIEGNFLSPKLVGGRVGLHPVWLMFSLFAFGYLFGFVGMLLAVPLAAAAGVLVRFALKRYQASPLYLGTSAGRQRDRRSQGPRPERRPPRRK